MCVRERERERERERRREGEREGERELKKEDDVLVLQSPVHARPRGCMI